MCTTGDSGEIIILSDDDDDDEQAISCSEPSVLIVEVEDVERNGSNFDPCTCCVCYIRGYKLSRAAAVVFQMLFYLKVFWMKTWWSPSPALLRYCHMHASTVPYMLSREYDCHTNFNTYLPLVPLG